MVYRIYTEKKPEYAQEARSLLAELREQLRIKNLLDVRILRRYDAERLERELFDACRYRVFAEPQVDLVYGQLPETAGHTLAVEYLPGQFDQRADSAAQCIQLIGGGERPLVKSAAVYLLEGGLTAEELAAVRRHLINPVESREAALELPDTLDMAYEIPPDVAVIEGFLELDEAGGAALISRLGLAMDESDLQCCENYFRSEGRCPTLTELKLIDTYWSDHCRHTTFSTIIDEIRIEDPDAALAWQRYEELRQELRIGKPATLMNLATIGAKYLQAQGLLTDLDESEEINACTVRITVDAGGVPEPWLLLFKNETHNHPTEIEPFGGAATCIGGAIRDPLSGRGYVYQAMRLTGAGDPTVPATATLPGKLPQRTIVTKAAAGYSSYGNQIGLATGLVDEIYHPGYVAKRMEVGAVVAAAPVSQVRREKPAPGDLVLLLGGRTGRDGCGGATGSSKSHDAGSLTSCGAEVQKGNAPEERKLQRLFRNGAASRLIKRCNDFGAGGVSVAIGELAEGLSIDLDAVPRKYEGLDGTELAISESQERMAVVLDQEDLGRFLELAAAENIEATVVAEVTAEPRLLMRWRGRVIVDIARAFLSTNGAEKHIRILVEQGQKISLPREHGDFASRMLELAADLNVCSKRGLAERFDSTVGAANLLMPFGGRRQLTPIQTMVSRLPVAGGDTATCSLMAYGFDPYVSSASPYLGAYAAVVESVAKLAAAGADLDSVHLSFQEYFPKPGLEGRRWGAPAAALLGGLMAQLDLGMAAIGGKDSMSGTFEQLDVPPTLISFAVALGSMDNLVSPELKGAGHQLVWLAPDYLENGLPEASSLRRVLAEASALIRDRKALAASTPARGGIAAALLQMAAGNAVGVSVDAAFPEQELFARRFGGFIIELAQPEQLGVTLGHTQAEYRLDYGVARVPLADLERRWAMRLESVFPCDILSGDAIVPTVSYRERGCLIPRAGAEKPKVLIPVFPGTNCEYDTAAAFARAGAEPRVLVIRNITAAAIAESVAALIEAINESQIVALPGGFSGGDEPDGSGKFITALFRNAGVSEAVARLLQQRDGLMLGICNGFQALIKLGLVPYGEIRENRAEAPTLTFNTIGRHQSRLVRVRVASVKSPWMNRCQVGDIHTVAVSHGEGRFICPTDFLEQMALNGQVAAQYADEQGRPAMDMDVNPNGSLWAVEALTSADGRVFGRMSHPERWIKGNFQNVPGNFETGLFESAVEYYRI